MEKRCPKCGLTKEVEDFYRRPDGRPQGYCKACQNEDRKARYARSPELRDRVKARSKAHYEAHKERHRDYSAAYQAANRERLKLQRKERTLRARYGVGLTEYDALLSQQGGVCAICQGTQRHGWTYFCVDHDHATGVVRGLLCDFCNRAVGSLEDDADRAQRMATYLRR